MSDNQKITLQNGIELVVDSENLEDTFDHIIEQFVKPFYQENNDWNKTVGFSIKEVEKISALLNKSKTKLIQKFLKRIESRLDQDFAYLPGTDKIEILFEALDDYVQNIKEIFDKEGTKEETRLNITRLIENLNLFEMSELLIYYAGAKKNESK